jgi:hypothetical protein
MSADSTAQVIDTSPEAQLRAVRESESAELSRQQQLLERSEKAEQERKIIQKTVYDVSNPSPLAITCVVIGMLLVMYIIYLMFLKPCMSGEWVDNIGNTWNINHDKLRNVFDVTVNGKSSGVGIVYDNYIKYGKLIGAWDYSDRVVFTDGIILERVL